MAAGIEIEDIFQYLNEKDEMNFNQLISFLMPEDNQLMRFELETNKEKLR